MENKDITKQMIDYSKSAFETGYNSMLMLQEQSTKVFDSFIKQSPWIPMQAKTAIDEWSNMYKKGAEDFKQAADENYERLEEMYSSFGSTETPKSKSKTKTKH